MKQPHGIGKVFHGLARLTVAGLRAHQGVKRQRMMEQEMEMLTEMATREPGAESCDECSEGADDLLEALGGAVG
jgi:hypothetical protein